MRLLIILVCCCFFLGCSDLDDLGYNDPEQYNIVELTFVNSDDNQTSFLSYEDPDLEGPLSPIVSTVQLKNNTSYSIELNFAYDYVLDEEDRIDRNEEILMESKVHQVFLILENPNNSAISLLEVSDTDENENPLGLEWNMITNTTGAVNLRVVLVHDPIKPNEDLLSAEGIIEFDATVNFVIQG
mgnify:CR=1 FL=1